MTEFLRRTVLLARPGVACERLRRALCDAGAQVVLEADPAMLDPPTLRLAAPQVIVVALEAVIEEAIERLDPVLADPAIEVIYEEAVLAATREGWDLARWNRHLSAKLQGHGDVLPPGHEPEDEVESSSEASLSQGPPPAPVEVKTGLNPFDPVTAERGYAPVMTVASPPSPMAVQVRDAIEMPLLDEPGTVSADDAAPMIEPFVSSFDYERAPTAMPVAVELLDTGSHDAGPRETPAETPVQRSIPVIPVLLFEASRSPGSAPDDVAPAAPAARVAVPPAPDWSFADETASAAVANTGSHASNTLFQHDLGELETRISSLKLVEEPPVITHDSEHGMGAVLVLAGIGGPDAVRQLLGALPDTFPRPVLLQQRLDGGRYDRLVAQMQRASVLQVRLAEPGQLAMARTIHILPAGMGIAVSGSGIRFTEGEGDAIVALPSADSAVLLLSGADPAHVDAVMNQSWAGALVAGQSPDGCYDAAASNALIARGGLAGQPAELAERLIARWH